MSDYQGTKIPVSDFVAAIRNNSKDGKYVSASTISEALGISTMTVTRYARKWNKEHPEDPIEVARGLGFRMNCAPIVESEEKENRYDCSKTEEGYSDPTAAAAMEEDNPIKSHTLWLTKESNNRFAYFAVLRATEIGAVGYRFDTVEGHPYANELVTPSYISTDGVSDKNDLVCDLVRPTFKLRKYMVEKTRDLSRAEVRNLSKAVAELIGTDYFLRQQLNEKTREVFLLNRRIESLKKTDSKEVSTKVVDTAAIYSPVQISSEDLAVLKAQNEIYKTFFDRMTSGTNVNATIRVEEN